MATNQHMQMAHLRKAEDAMSRVTPQSDSEVFGFISAHALLSIAYALASENQFYEMEVPPAMRDVYALAAERFTETPAAESSEGATPPPSPNPTQ